MDTIQAGQAGAGLAADRRNVPAYPDMQSNSARLYDRAVKVLPGGNSRHTVFFPPYPVYAVRGAGSRVWDADGVERTDFINNYSSLIHGHNHPAIVGAVVRQAKTLLSVSLPTEAEIRLAELVTERLPCVEQVRFCNSGSEGVLFAIKAARAYTGRSKIAMIEGAYHGSSETAVVSTGPGPDAWGDAANPNAVNGPGNGDSVTRDVVVLPLNDVENARRIIRAHAADLAGVVIDAMPSAIGFLPVAADFLTMIREELDACGGLLVFDEVYSLRLGFNGAQGALGVRVDITALGKIIGGGLPIGAVGGPAHIMSALFDPREAGGARLAHGGTFNANPMTMAAGAAAMELFDRAAFDRVSALGDRLRAGFTEALKISGKPGRVTGTASLCRLGHSDAPLASYRDLYQIRQDGKTPARTENFFRHMLNRGVLIGAPGLFILSTAMTEADIDATIEKALEGLRLI
ncbi:Beta-phenylalanine transaminase [Alphaproteobacteria bacterium SO-S41]|nr:Beta-phenylalanine transaminase [Alphaproteobacteria bacterium SO-S41]